MSIRKALAAALVALLVFFVGAASARQSKERQKPACCFNHPRYAGSCVVDPAPDETCRSILAYLNNPKAAGKTYCSNTVIRSGWKAVRCNPARDSD